MTRGGKTKDRAEAERRCIVHRDAAPRAGLVRFVVSPDGILTPDVLEKLPGRGIWVTSDLASLETAVNKGLFARAAKGPVKVPDGLTDQVEGLLASRVTGLIAMARKAGLAVAGFEKVKGWLAGGDVRVLLQASDGSTRGKSKLWTPEGARYFDCLTADELGLAFGRQSVIHGALASGGISDRVVEEAARLKGLRDKDGVSDERLKG